MFNGFGLHCLVWPQYAFESRSFVAIFLSQMANLNKSKKSSYSSASAVNICGILWAGGVFLAPWLDRSALWLVNLKLPPNQLLSITLKSSYKCRISYEPAVLSLESVVRQDDEDEILALLSTQNGPVSAVSWKNGIDLPRNFKVWLENQLFWENLSK